MIHFIDNFSASDGWHFPTTVRRKVMADGVKHDTKISHNNAMRIQYAFVMTCRLRPGSNGANICSWSDKVCTHSKICLLKSKHLVHWFWREMNISECLQFLNGDLQIQKCSQFYRYTFLWSHIDANIFGSPFLHLRSRYHHGVHVECNLGFPISPIFINNKRVATAIFRHSVPICNRIG